MTKRSNLFTSILDAADYLETQGVDVSSAIKRRDPVEPGRRQKEEFEDKMFVIMMRYFRRTKKKIRTFFEEQFPDRKALFRMGIIPPDPGVNHPDLREAFNKQIEPLLDLTVLLEDPRLLAELLLWLTSAADSGIDLFEVETGFGVSAAANVAASEWARQHAGDLIEFLTNTQRDTIQRAVSTFIETPGMTIGETVNQLIGDKLFSEDRAMRIAVSEVTNTFSEADRIAGEQLQEDEPDVLVVKRWFTNNDGLVCTICAPLHRQEVPIDEKFISVDTEDGTIREFDGPPGHVANCRCWRRTRTRIGG